MMLIFPKIVWTYIPPNKKKVYINTYILKLIALACFAHLPIKKTQFKCNDSIPYETTMHGIELCSLAFKYNNTIDFLLLLLCW